MKLFGVSFFEIRLLLLCRCRPKETRGLLTHCWSFELVYWFLSNLDLVSLFSTLCKGHVASAISTQTLLSLKPRGEFQHQIQQRIEHWEVKKRHFFYHYRRQSLARSLAQGITKRKSQMATRDYKSLYSDTNQREGRTYVGSVH